MERLKMLWPPYRRRRHREIERDEYQQKRDRAFEQLNAGGWISWEFSRPMTGLVEIVRLKDYTDEAYKPHILNVEDVHPWMNIVDLYWRPASGPIVEPAESLLIEG